MQRKYNRRNLKELEILRDDLDNLEKIKLAKKIARIVLEKLEIKIEKPKNLEDLEKPEKLKMVRGIASKRLELEIVKEVESEELEELKDLEKLKN